MKATTKTAVLGACVAAATTVSLPLLINQEANAQETKATDIVVPGEPSPGEQYKVLSLLKWDNDGPGRMEIELNKLAAQGWRVRTGVGGAVILAK
jgi:hypothetical protein